jgi:hypothetical protein
MDQTDITNDVATGTGDQGIHLRISPIARFRDYNVTTTPGQSTRDVIAAGNMGEAHSQFQVDPEEA